MISLAGSILAAPITTYIGRQKCLLLNCIFFLLGAAIMTASTTLPMCRSFLSDIEVRSSTVMGGRFTVGLGVGAMSMVCPTYVSELSPKHIRGRITGLFQVVVVIGVAGM
jgi:MFS family permease